MYERTYLKYLFFSKYELVNTHTHQIFKNLTSRIARYIRAQLVFSICQSL